MFFRNNKYQTQTFLSIKMRKFLSDKYKFYSTTLYNSMLNKINEAPLNEIEIQDLADEILRDVRVDIMSEVAEYIDKSYQGKGQDFIDTFSSITIDQNANNYSLDVEKILRRGPMAGDILTIAVNTLFPDDEFLPLSGQSNNFYKTMFKVIYQLEIEEINTFGRGFAPLKEEGLIPIHPYCD